MVEQLRSRLQETQQSLQSSTSELQQLQVEHDMLLERHNKILQETVSKEAELRERYRHAHLNMPSYCLRLTRVELCYY